MTAYYSENDPYAAEWLRVLILEGLIAPGYVDERSIEDVKPAELRGFTQCHFFAGIGGWSHALRLAHWPDDRPVWTGSCPCQPFSNAGKKKGNKDERHLWPIWFRLIKACKPEVIFGEQVANSVTIGRIRNAVDYLRSLQKGAELRTVPDARKTEEISRHLQILPEQARTAASNKISISNERTAESLARQEPRFSADFFSQMPSARSGTSFRSDSAVGATEDRQGPMRDDRNKIPTQLRVGLAITASDQSEEGVHQAQCENCASLSQHHDEYLGPRESVGDRPSVAPETLNDSARADDKSTGAEATVWIDAVFDDLESAHYSCAAGDIPAAGVGAPHIRQRLYWVADRVADRRRQGLEVLSEQSARQERASVERSGETRGLGDADSGRRTTREQAVASDRYRGSAQSTSCWRDVEWIYCRDGKYRPVEPGTSPLAHGISGRVQLLRGYGNGICAPLAAAFIEAYDEIA